MDYKGRHVAVLGLGRSGEAAAVLLLDHGADVTVLDSGDPAPRREAAVKLSSRGARVVLGDDALRCAQDFDFAVLSPGIDPVVPLARRPVEAGIPLLGEIELAFRNCRCPVIAITGTNGKTTTTGLTAALLNAAGLRAEACGNIGLPFSEVAARSAQLAAAVVEISSFQLESTDSFRPKVAVWTNFSANHLDRYPDVAAYRAAKLRIFDRQTAEDFAVVNARLELPALRARRITFSAARAAEADFTLDGSVILHGGREIDGVTWINDSKSTNLDALAQALQGQTGGVILIAGGKNKGFDFAPVAPLVGERVREAVLIGEMRQSIARDWSVPCHPVDSLESAVGMAQSLARRGDTVLFSPGTSSFDMFRSYEERGDLFKHLTHQIQPKEKNT